MTNETDAVEATAAVGGSLLEAVVSLRPCPCGRPIESLSIIDAGHGGRYAYVSGNCCGEWMIEFRADFMDPAKDECMQRAIRAWNSAPRAS